MNRVTVAMSWCLAIVVALVIARRVRRGRHVVLTGRFSPRILRMVVMILVAFGVGCEKKPPATATASGGAGVFNPPDQPDAGGSVISNTETRDAGSTAIDASTTPPSLVTAPKPDTLPDAVSPIIVDAWIRLQEPNSWWTKLKLEMVRAPTQPPTTKASITVKLLQMFELDRAARKDGGKDPPLASNTEMIEVLDDIESRGFYDHFLAAYLWRKASATAAADASKDRAELYARLRKYVRVTDTLLAAYAEVRPVMRPPRAWMSKAMRPRTDVDKSVLDMHAAAERIFPTTDLGTWKRDGVVLLSPSKGALTPSPRLIPAGAPPVALKSDVVVRFGRLDLLDCPKDSPAPCAVDHDIVGRIDIPAGRTASVWDLPDLLSTAGAEKMRATVKAALDGDEKMALTVERMLPLAHREVRSVLKKSPKAKGAPRLRMILALFDDVPMPTPVAPITP